MSAQQLSMAEIAPGVTGEKIMKDAADWRYNNYTAYMAMKKKAMERLAEGRRTSISELVEEARYTMRLNGYDGMFRVNNTTRAGLARLMIAECPALAKAIETRASKADWAS